MALSPYNNSSEAMREAYAMTEILRKPVSGIVSGYHNLSYILIAPGDENSMHTVEITGQISVSPKFIISAESLQETFGDIFDPSTFDREIRGRMFSFACRRDGKPVKIHSERFSLDRLEVGPQDHLNRKNDELMRQEDTRTGLIFSPNFQYYPVSIDRFISEIVDREFRV
ncbi:MAG: hypothetical protein MUF22_08580 [Chitinispirillaceae bacterium]|jgi:hypothetical protein|nr:hypothetical protein [Chitinispirillaceae bacterium]